MDTDSFIIHIKTENVFEKRFDTSNYEVNIPLPKGKNKKVTGLMKGKLGRNIRLNLLHLGQNHILT